MTNEENNARIVRHRELIASLNFGSGWFYVLPEEERDLKDDPWWWYYVAQARDADDLLEAMQRPYLTERLQ